MKTFKQFILEGKKKKEQKAALATLTGQINDKMAQKEANKPFTGPEFGVGTKPNSPERDEAIRQMMDYNKTLKPQLKKRQQQAEKAARNQLGL